MRDVAVNGRNRRGRSPVRCGLQKTRSRLVSCQSGATMRVLQVPRRTRMRYLVQAGRCWPRQGPTGTHTSEEGVEVCLSVGAQESH